MCCTDCTDVEINEVVRDGAGSKTEDARDGAGSATQEARNGAWPTLKDTRDGARPATEDALALPIDRYTVRAIEALVARRSQDGQ